MDFNASSFIFDKEDKFVINLVDIFFSFAYNKKQVKLMNPEENVSVG